MRTYYKLQNIYHDKQAHATDRAIPGEPNCRVSLYTDSTGGRGYRVKFHGTTIIEAHTGGLDVTLGGWDTITTRKRLRSIADVTVTRNNKLPFVEKCRIYDASRGYTVPMPRTARLQYGTRRLDDSCVHPDRIVRVTSAGRRGYAALVKDVWGKLQTRIALGEFDGGTTHWLPGYGSDLAMLETVQSDIPSDHDVIYDTFQYAVQRARLGIALDARTIPRAWANIVDTARGTYYQKYNAYTYEDIDNV